MCSLLSVCPSVCSQDILNRYERIFMKNAEMIGHLARTNRLDVEEDPDVIFGSRIIFGGYWSVQAHRSPTKTVLIIYLSP